MPNPFSVKAAEDISANETRLLFVDVFSDFHKVITEGHTFIHGPRGCGKSMMFRYLLPDCQCLQNETSLDKLAFFGVYIPVKNTNPNVTELTRLENSNASYMLNEHFLCMYVAAKVFATFKDIDLPPKGKTNFNTQLNHFCNRFIYRMQRSGLKKEIVVTKSTNPKQTLIELMDICNEEYHSLLIYLRKLSFDKEPLVYDGPLTGYVDFLYPMLKDLKELSFMPKGPVYLMIDDADNLNETQTKILNSWVSMRTTSEVSIKVSTQLNYKTYRTVSGDRIDYPHDYSEINISTQYTSVKGTYFERLRAIVKKRLSLKGIDIEPEVFFPPDKAQEEKIKAIADQLTKSWATEGRGNKRGDDALRYARPTFIASLKGTSKSGSTYSYAGFEQLVHISDGRIRYFLEPAAKMYSETSSRNKSVIKAIPPSIQNKIITEEAEKFIFAEFDKLIHDEEKYGCKDDKPRKLFNLLKALGGTFHLVLLSERSERRVISIAFSDQPDIETLDVLKLGVRYGYFTESSIGNKDGTGRTRLYILSRRLAPHFKLDPNGFAGYLFVTKDIVKEAMLNPDKLLRKFKTEGVEKHLEQVQLSLFE